MSSRKKAKGKARKAAKAQQQQQEAAAVADQRGSLHSQLQQRQGNNSNANTNTKKLCQHGFGTQAFPGWRICDTFMGEFMNGFNASGRHDDQDLRAATDSTYEKYSNVWNDASKLEWVISCFVANGTRYILDGTGGDGGEDKHATKDYAIIAYYLEQYIAVMLRKSQDKVDWEKIRELQVDNNPSEHVLVSFYQKRNPCSCLSRKYKEGEKEANAIKKKELEEEENNQQKQKKPLFKTMAILTESEEDEGGKIGEICESYCVSSGFDYWKSFTDIVSEVDHGAWGEHREENMAGGELAQVTSPIQQPPSLN